MLTLTKLSSPGYTKEFKDYSDLLEHLRYEICRSCNAQALVEALLGTACGAEYMLEDDYA